MHNPFATWKVTQTWDEHPTATKGVDWAAPEGTPLPAFADATVHFIPNNGTAGNTAVLYTNEGHTRYLHCATAEFPTGWHYLSEGETVAFVGSTGLSTGPHVHVDSWRDGIRVPPFFLTAPASTTITPFDPEEDDMTKNTYIAWRDAEGVQHNAILNTESGFFSAFTSAAGGYNTDIARAFDVPPTVMVTESHAEALRRSCEAVRTVTA